jgi:diadenosine tetraphosphate (Ap4A) HIT family hydrolase
MHEHDCYYCRLNSGPDESEHFIRIWGNEATIVYLHRDQSLPGRVVVAAAHHAGDISEMSSSANTAFFETVWLASRAIRQAYPQTEKINLSLCGNEQRFRHPHIHVLPRRPDDRSWPAFINDFQLPYWPLGDDRYEEAVSELRMRIGLRETRP